MSKTYQIECDRCTKFSNYSEGEEVLSNQEYKEIVKIGKQTLNLCEDCYRYLTKNPLIEEQLSEDILCDIMDILRRY